MLDFLLIISRSDEDAGYRITLQRRGESAALAVARVPPIDRARWKATYLDPLSRFVEEPFSHERQMAWGRELAALLLPPPVCEVLCAEASRHEPTTPLRLRLVIAPAELADLPWEFVCLDAVERQEKETPLTTHHSPLTRTGFLCLQPHFHLVRQPQPLTINPQPLTLDALRVLIVWADPRSAAYPALPGLASEVRNVLSALRSPECRRVEVDELRNATPSALQRRLKEQPPHILHFVGHGDVRASGGVLVLEGAQPGAEEAVYADDLAQWLLGTPVRIVVLSACRTGASVRGVGATLAARGVPCVVAMQLPLRDATAGHFARAFYSALVTSSSVENAVSEGRQAVRGAGADWGVPVLWLAGESSDLLTLRDIEPPPTNLPYRANPYFLGRESALSELHRLLHASPRTSIALVGMGGIGKTQLAVEYAHAHAADYPGGVFYLNAENTSSLEYDYATLGGFFDVPATLPTHERAMLVRDRLYRLRQPSLLILDNVTDDTRLALPPGGSCHIILTTRKGYLARRGGCHILNVRELDEDAALSLLQIRRSADSDTEETAARAIARKVGFHPLMLTLIANYVGQVRISLATYLQDYVSTSRFEFIDPTVNDVLDRTHRELKPFAQWVLATAACFAGQGISRDLLQSACDLPSRRDFIDALAELDDFSLITRTEDDRLTLHELVRTFAQGKTSDDERRPVVERVAAALTDCLRQANEKMDWTSARPEIPHCLAVSELVRMDAAPPARYALWFEMAHYYLEHRDYEPSVTHFEEALAAAQEAFGSDHIAVAECLRDLSLAEQGLGNVSKAIEHQRQACTLAQSALAPDAPSLAEFYNDMGYVLRMQGDLDRALSYYLKAFEMYVAAYGRQHREVAVSLNNIGMLRLAQGKPEDALADLREALAIDRAASGRQSKMVAIRLNNIGQALMKLANPQEALTHHREALDIYESIYGHWNLDVAYTHRFMGNALRALGEEDNTLAHYRQSLAICEHLHGPHHPRCQDLRDIIRSIEGRSEEPPCLCEKSCTAPSSG